MLPANTGEELLARARRTDVLDTERLTGFLDLLGNTGQVPDQPRELADLLVARRILTPFQAEELLAGREQSFLMGGKYRQLDLLGTGGMGRVYLCEHLRMRRLVAIKVLPEDQMRVPGAIERFEREARAVAALKHPNIVQAYDIDQEGDVPFLVMEYVEGKSLEAIVESFGGLNVPHAVSAIVQAARGLQYAFETAGLVHRDIKPGNLLLERQGTVKILDLGLARFFFDKTDKLTSRYDHNSVLGTVDYLSPEQAENSSNVDIRTDIYSLGGTLYTLLTGQRPFGEGGLAQKLLWAQIRDPRPISDFRDDVPEEVALVIRKMMAKDRNQRYARPGEVIEALAPWIPAAPPIPPEPWMGPHRDVFRRPAESPGTPTVTPTPYLLPSSLVPTPRAPETASKTTRLPPAARAVAPAIQRFWWLVLIGTAIALGAVAALQFWPTPRPGGNQPRGPRLPTTLLVDHSGEPGRYPSIRAAVAASIPGDRIHVREARWEESLRLGAEDLPAGNLSIEGRTPEGNPVVWLPGPDHIKDEALLEISNLSRIRIVGFRCDGKDRCRNLIRLSGICPGLLLDHLEMQGFSNCAVLAHDLVGDPTPVVFSHLHIRCRAEAGGVRLETASGITRFITLTACRFDGPGRAALLLEGECADIMLERIRMGGLDAGIHLTRKTPPQRAHLKWTSSTVYATKVLLDLAQEPETTRYGPWVVENNLFLQVQKLVVIGREPLPAKVSFLASKLWNVSNQIGLEGFSLLGCEKRSVEDVETRPDVDRLYLFYPKSSPLMKAALGGKPVGVPPEEG